MSRHDTKGPEQAPRRSRAQDVFVLAAMALVAAAATVALLKHGGAEPWVAGTSGLALFALFVASHALFRERRAPRPRRVARPPREAARPQQPPAAAEAGDGLGRKPVETPAGAVRMPGWGDRPVRAPAAPEAPVHDPVRRDADLFTYAPAHAPRTDVPPAPDRALESAPPPGPRLEPYVPPALDPLQAYWSYAPGAPRLEEPARPAPASAELATRPFTTTTFEPPVVPPPLELPELSEAATPRQEDVEVIQNLIKKLADEVNAAERSQAAAGRASESAPALPDAPPAPGAYAEPPLPDFATDVSLAALRTAVTSMRNAAGPRPHADAPPAYDERPPAPHSAPAPLSDLGTARAHGMSAAATVPPPVPGAHPNARVAAISEAIAAGRVDVLLEPIMGLGMQRAQHYEVTLRLRAPSGDIVASDQRIEELRGAGLLPLMDAARMARTVNVAARIGERGKGGAVFSTYSGGSLGHRAFLDDVAAALHGRPATAGQLVLTFTQNDVRLFGVTEWSALADLQGLGFRFALSGVTDLDMDFGGLAASGFSFVKLGANVFLEGLAAPTGAVPPVDICLTLASRGLTLVVEGIDSEDKLARIFGFGVLLGQGQLFGGPRPVKADIAAGHRDAAA